jgi:hypothetical protein
VPNHGSLRAAYSLKQIWRHPSGAPEHEESSVDGSDHAVTA